jgi:putative resolvase
MDKFIARKEALKILGIHYHTLYRLVEDKEIEILIIGNKNFYNINGYLKKKGINMEEKKQKKNIAYCRVSSQKQKEDLARQIEYIKERYPNHEIISDIGSGLNMNRKGLQKIIDLGIKGEINELVITYKDRLARFGYDMIENIIEKYSSGKIVVINNEIEKTPLEEVSEDIVSIMNIYVAKINGLRKYKEKIKKAILEENITK